MHLALIGLGLIGGSVARAVRTAGGWTVAAWTPSGRGPRAALAAGVIDAATANLDDAVRDADLVVLAAPPLEAVALVATLAASSALPPGATVTDVVSTKVAITDAARAAGLHFVGGHPMAGREIPGFAAASPDLFEARPWVVTEAVGRGDAELVERLAMDCRAIPIRLGAKEHDSAVAAISHLPLLASVALVESVLGTGAERTADDGVVRQLAASGWRDMTRLARGDAVMGAGILATNRIEVGRRLRAYRDALDGWLDLLERDRAVDAEAIRARLDSARER